MDREPATLLPDYGVISGISPIAIERLHVFVQKSLADRVREGCVAYPQPLEGQLGVFVVNLYRQPRGADLREAPAERIRLPALVADRNGWQVNPQAGGDPWQAAFSHVKQGTGLRWCPVRDARLG